MTRVFLARPLDLRARNRYRERCIACAHILRFVHTLAREDDLTVMAMSESWAEYVQRLTEGLDRGDIAAAADVHVSVVGRWLRGTNHPSAEKVISLARGLRQSPVEALVAAGYLDNTDVGGAVEIVQSLGALSDDTLIDELRTRLSERLGPRVDDSEPSLRDLAPLRPESDGFGEARRG